MTLTEQQYKVTERTLERLTGHPTTHDQTRWYFQRNPPRGMDLSVDGFMVAVDAHEMERCGALACAAGHAMLAARELGIDRPAGHVSNAAAKLLGLSENQAFILFFAVTDKVDVVRLFRHAVEHRAWPDIEEPTSPVVGSHAAILAVAAGAPTMDRTLPSAQ